ncbi:hypothetical protein MKX03_034943 [Papaver bracteatum]|nr:hypothetical protein MKX03_034943 [Papaver bracteatum]
MNLPIPVYTTTQPELVPIFISSLDFNGKSYTGPAARIKKDAERLAARMAIHSIIGNSGSGTSLPEIIISKSSLSNAFRMLEESQTIQDSHTAMVATPGSNCGGSSRKRKQILNPSSQKFVEGVISTPPPSEYKKHKANVAHLLDQPVSVGEHCRAFFDASRVVEASQTIQDANMVAVTCPEKILNSSLSQTPVEVVTATSPPCNGIGNTTTLSYQPNGCSDRKVIGTISWPAFLNFVFGYALTIQQCALYIRKYLRRVS